jgi:hypothetical protein
VLSLQREGEVPTEPVGLWFGGGVWNHGWAQMTTDGMGMVWNHGRHGIHGMRVRFLREGEVPSEPVRLLCFENGVG